MLKALFEWLDTHPGSYWAVALGSTLLLTVWIALAVWRESRRPVAAPPGARWRDALVLFLFLFAWRWPFLFATHEYNADESQLVAGALTLAHDPVFWRSVDGATSGPLNYYILLPLHWLGIPLGYFGARLTALLLVFGALFLCQRALAGSFGRAAAWLGVLPLAGFFATVTHPDLIHYSSEHLPLLLTALAGGLLAGRQPGDQRLLYAGCLVAGAAPWAKLQCGPLSVVLIGWGLWQALREPEPGLRIRLRRAAGAGLAALAPTLLVVALVAATGQMETMVRRYFGQNLLYVGSSHRLDDAVRHMTAHARLDGRVPLLLAAAGAVLLAASVYFVVRRRHPPALFAAGGCLTLGALVAVLAPRREFLHYVLFLPVPLTLWTGAAVGGWWAGLSSTRSRLVLAGLLFSLTGLPLVITRCWQQTPAIYGRFAYHRDHPRGGTALVVRALAGPDGSLGIWGWANDLYVESGLPQATRDGNSVWLITPTSQAGYHRAGYLDDLRRNRPPVFVDAVGPKAFNFKNRLTEAHEIFPPLAAYLGGNYTLVADLGRARIYARNGLPALRDLSPARLDELVAQGRVKSYPETTFLAAATPDELPRKVIAEQPVSMLPSSIPVELPLAGDEREVAFVFGVDPVAGGKNGNAGAGLTLAFVDNLYSRPVFSRFLDPARRPEDRGLQTALVTLPPLSPGAHLMLQTVPASKAHPAAPVYFADLRFHRRPGFLPKQFPGFNRVPDVAAADDATLSREDNASVLHLHPPAFFTFALRGNEQRLSFEYGLEPGPQSPGGQPESAVWQVELRRPGQPPRILFRRFLQPVANPADRGRQRDDFRLPAPRPGDFLTLHIGPGPGLANDITQNWTYISRLALE